MIHYDLLWSIAIDCDLSCSFVTYHDLLWSIMIQKWSEHGVFCTFWLGNVLRATTACNFSSLIWPDGSAPAALASLLFQSHKSFEKRKAFRDFPSFSRTCIFFLLTLSLLWSSLFGSSPLLTLPASAFPSVHIVGSLTSKLPSIMVSYDLMIQNWLAHLSSGRSATTTDQSLWVRVSSPPWSLHDVWWSETSPLGCVWYCQLVLVNHVPRMSTKLEVFIKLSDTPTSENWRWYVIFIYIYIYIHLDPNFL